MKAIKKITLTNGLRVLLVPQPENLAATVLILVEAGSEYETKAINGVSHFLEHMMFKGTVNRPKPGMIAHELASLGAQSNAFTGQEYTGYYAKVRAEKLPDILGIVADLYLNPLFERAEIDKERGVIIQEINMYEDDLPAKVQQVLDDLTYGDQPAGWDVGGTKKNIMHLGREDFMDYRAKRYVMPGMVVVVAGKFHEKDTLALIKEYFGHLPRRRVIAKKKTIERQSAPRVKVHFKKTDQAHLAIAFRAFNMFDPRRSALRVLADILGGGMSSRLFMRVREEMGAAYYVGAGADLSFDHGSLGISAGVDHLKIDAVIGAIFDECHRLCNEPVPAVELQKSKDHMLGNLILGLETSDDLASFYGGQEIFGREILSPEAYADRIKKVTAEEVRDVARAILRNQGLNFAVVGPYESKKRFVKTVRL
jgi:predicted Zn-dependent peptidase